MDNKWLDELKAKTDIVEVIGRYVPLNKRGRTYWGRCPFHHEKTASFAVNSAEQFYHCFGCKASGDVIRFVMEMENIDFMGTVKMLADAANMALPEMRADGDAAEKKKKRDRLLNMMTAAARHYYNNLKSEQAASALLYLRRRGVSDKTIVKFGLGMSLDMYRLIRDLKAQGYSCQEMTAGGLAKEKDGKIYDALCGRLIFPIFNSFGQVIAFGGRLLEDKKFAKYKNTEGTKLYEKSKDSGNAINRLFDKKTELFDKGANLYGINFVKKIKQEQGLPYLIVVEGYMDTIGLVQAGIENVVASMGTALTPVQAKLIKRYVDKVYICYDGDAAGQKATLRGLDVLKAEGLEVMVMTVPDGKDPDEIVIANGAEAFIKLVDGALPLTEYKLRTAEAGLDKNSAGDRAKYAKRAIEILRELPSAVEQNAYLPLVAGTSNIDSEALEKELYKTSEESVAPKERNSESAEPPYYVWARMVLNAALSGKLPEGEDISAYFDEAVHGQIYAYIRNAVSGGGTVTVSNLYSVFPDEPEVDRIANILISKDENKEAVMRDSLDKLKKRYKDARINELVKKISAETDAERKKELMSELNELARNK